MKKTLKESVLIIAALFMLSCAAAQMALESPTLTATADTIGTEIDACFSVTDWTTVNPGDGLAFALYDGNGIPGIGGAKYFGDIFAAGCVQYSFGGSASYKSYSTTTGKVLLEDKGSENGFQVTLLAGLPEVTSTWGFKLLAGMEDLVKETEEQPTYTPILRITKKTGKTYFAFSAGAALAAGEGTIKPLFEISKTNFFSEKESSSATTVSDSNYNNTYSVLKLLAQADYLFPKQGSVQHVFGGSFAYIKGTPKDDQKFYNVQVNNDIVGFNRIEFRPWYVFNYGASEQLEFVAKTIVLVNWQAQEYGGVERSMLYITPRERLGLSYKADGKLTVNGGYQFNLLTYQSIKQAKKSDLTILGPGSWLYGGFTLDVTKNHTIDTGIEFSGTPTLSLSVSYKK